MIGDILSRLDGVRRNGDGKFVACCPAHDDSDPSLAITEVPDGRILMHCFAHCDTGSIMAAIGLSLSDLFPDGAIDHHLRGATPWLHKQRVKKQASLENERLILEMADADRAQGKRLSRQDLEREKEAFLRIQQAGKMQ